MGLLRHILVCSMKSERQTVDVEVKASEVCKKWFFLKHFHVLELKRFRACGITFSHPNAMCA
jgi:hypothetical protein